MSDIPIPPEGVPEPEQTERAKQFVRSLCVVRDRLKTHPDYLSIVQEHMANIEQAMRDHDFTALEVLAAMRLNQHRGQLDITDESINWHAAATWEILSREQHKPFVDQIRATANETRRRLMAERPDYRQQLAYHSQKLRELSRSGATTIELVVADMLMHQPDNPSISDEAIAWCTAAMVEMSLTDEQPGIN